MTSQTLDRIIEGFCSYWSPGKKPAGSPLDDACRRAGLVPERLYSISEASEATGLAAVEGEHQKGHLVPDAVSANSKGALYYGWRILLSIKKPDYRRNYRHVMTEADTRERHTAENVLHASPELVNELIMNGELKIRGGYVSGKDLLAVYRRIVRDLQPGDLGIRQRLSDAPEGELYTSIRRKFLGKMAERAEEIAASHGIELGRWYILEDAARFLATTPPFISARAGQVGFPEERGYVTGLAVVLADMIPNAGKISRYSMIEKQKGNLRKKVMRFFCLDDVQYNTLQDRGILAAGQEDAFTTISMRGLYFRLLEGAKPEDLGITLLPQPEDRQHEVSGESVLEIIFSKFRQGIQANLPGAAALAGVDLARKGYTAREICDTFGISRSSVKKAEDEGVLRQANEAPRGKIYHSWSVALMVARDSSPGFPDADNVCYLRQDLAEGIAREDVHSFPFLSQGDIELLRNAHLVRSANWGSSRYLDRSDITGFWKEMCRRLSAHDMEGMAVYAPVTSQKEEDSSLDAILPVFAANTARKVQELSLVHGIPYDREYTTREVTGFFGTGRSTVVSCSDKGILKKTGTGLKNTYEGWSVVLLTCLPGTKRTYTIDEAMQALRLSPESMDYLQRQGMLGEAAESPGFIPAREVYSTYRKLMSRTEKKDLGNIF